MVLLNLKEELRYVLINNMVVFVIGHLIIMQLLLSVDNWVILMEKEVSIVCLCLCVCVHEAIIGDCAMQCKTCTYIMFSLSFHPSIPSSSTSLFYTAIPLPFAFFGPGTRGISIDEVQCNGNESQLTDCGFNPDPFFCFSFLAASVLCQGQP